MGMLDILLGKKQSPVKPRNSRSAPNSTQFVSSQASSNASSPHNVRKDLLKLVLRETLTRNGIPQVWVAADMLRTTSPKREQGIHMRFVVRVWEPRLMAHGPALEKEFLQRLLLLDPQAANWLMGFSWQFALPDNHVPGPMPHPGSWTAPREAAAPLMAPETKPGDIIEGPVVIPRPAEDVRADLERLLAARDDDMKRHAQGGDNFAATRPATL
ncbi:hypothetical protein H8N03_04045 [Ramlibacter sp. USB13]|uniref:Uncharacterized protein n=1 Tax=Ramlibacter cellulosilyticus TaxID=2764187 RepID=A0A923MNT4_9BURK|nr:hypothetical protein [Ramlibacter cellulosilyticus]MBC5782103.1 hypothetical protein [Ramlibacter cellulosilyticus]